MTTTLKEYISKELNEDKLDDELLRIDIANAFIEKFASQFGFQRSQLNSTLIASKQLIRVSLGRGGQKSFAGQLVVQYPSTGQYKITRFDGLFNTADMKKWATTEFDKVFKSELKKGKIR